MTKKVTISLEETLINELNIAAQNLGKKKTQIIREALQSYLKISSKEEKIALWEKENKDAIESYNKMVDEEGLILKNNRMF